MILAEILLGARGWLTPALGLACLATVAAAWAYLPAAARSPFRLVCLGLKLVAFLLLTICLVDPLYVAARPRTGSNLFLVAVDNSRSLQLTNRGSGRSRGAEIKASVTQPNGWLGRLGQDFNVRPYTFDAQLRPTPDFADLDFTGEASSLFNSLETLTERYRGQPVAGILLLTDGDATDLDDRTFAGRNLPPIYPVAAASAANALDVALAQVTVSQTSFEAAPVTLIAEVEAQGAAGRKIVLRVLDEKQQEVERRSLTVAKDSDRLSQRFLIKPEHTGISFYQVHVALDGEEHLPADSSRSAEATLANNRRLATVDRGGGPYRVLYVSGLPNWEYKFLRRALAKDDEVDLVGLVRIARKEPKFAFLSRTGERTNPLFRGFDNKDDEQAEQYDEPVLLRLGTENAEELRGGFPKDAEDLFRYHAIILDDLESAFFTQDQLSLLRQFVGKRGGGLLMLGGKGSFGEGGYARSPVAEMLPVYVNRVADATGKSFQLKLTKEGWLQPWIRVRAEETEEKTRLAAMPPFQSLNRIDAVKPGATVLAEVETAEGEAHPALVVQPFGRGRTAALLVGDLWRWELRRAEVASSDLEKSWRQTVRWLVADVPQPVEVETRRSAGSGLPGREIVIRARDKSFQPLDNAQVTVTVQTPDGRKLTLVAEGAEQTAGEYRTLFVPRTAGAYRAKVTVVGPDGAEVGARETGWGVEPETEEFRRLSGDRPLLERLAKETGGEVLELHALDRFVTGLPNRKIPITETWTFPLWHQWSVLALAGTCLVGEWGLRRWKGLP